MVRILLQHIAGGLARLGAAGLFFLSIADSSFLTLPLGNDLLVIVLSAGRPAHALWYATVACAGSVIGCAITGFATRKGEGRLERRMGQKRLISIKRLSFIKYEVDQRVGWLLAIACLMPPPFPFTPFVAGAAAFGYPRKKLLGIVAAARMARFAAESELGVHYGWRVISFTQTPMFVDLISVLIGLAILGSSLSIYHWLRASRKQEG
jgi:membrane protein YqaA with SNARE-associated domain